MNMELPHINVTSQFSNFIFIFSGNQLKPSGWRGSGGIRNLPLSWDRSSVFLQRVVADGNCQKWILKINPLNPFSTGIIKDRFDEIDGPTAFGIWLLFWKQWFWMPVRARGRENEKLRIKIQWAPPLINAINQLARHRVRAIVLYTPCYRKLYPGVKSCVLDWQVKWISLYRFGKNKNLWNLKIFVGRRAVPHP